MNRLSKIFIEVRASLRGIAADLENHEAVADAAIRRLEGVRAKTAMQAGQIQTIGCPGEASGSS